MSDESIDEFLNALGNETNESVMNLNSNKIKSLKNDMLQRLGISGKELKLFHKKLKAYRYCSDMSDIQFGCYIRWIPLKTIGGIKLTNGGIIIDIDIINNCVQIKVKNNMNRIFQIKFDECYIFQKLTNQENIILGVLNYLGK